MSLFKQIIYILSVFICTVWFSVADLIIDPYRFVAVTDSPGTANLLGWWKLDDAGDPATWEDAHTTDADLTKTGTVLSTTGKVSGGGQFDSGDVLANAPFSNTFHQSDFSVGGWVFVDVINTDQLFMSQDGISPIGVRHWHLNFTNAGDKLKFLMFNSASTVFTAETNSAISVSTWYFVVGVRSGATMTIYLNGTAQTTTATFSGTENTTDRDLNVGKASLGHEGILDEVFVFSKALSQTEITWLYNSGNGRTYGDL